MIVPSSAQRCCDWNLMAPVVFISAGEASGEQYGALLAAALVPQIYSKG